MPALVIALAITILAAAGGLLWSRRRLASAQYALDARLPRGAAGIIVGAEPIELEKAGAPAVLLLHGGGDTPQSMHYLAEALSARGYSVSVPLLPGHGRSIEEFGASTANDWLGAAREAFRRLRSSHPWVGIAGISMGGAIAVQLAAEHDDLPALALLAPYLAMPAGDAMAASLCPLWGWLIPVTRTASPGSILDPRERAQNLAYGVFAPSALHGLWITQRRGAAALHEVRAPTLVVQSRQDNRISVRAAERAFRRLASPEKRMEWVEGTGHVITVDYGHERVCQMVGDWLDARCLTERVLSPVHRAL